MSNLKHIDATLGEMLREEIVRRHGALKPEAIKQATGCSHELAAALYGLWILDKGKKAA